MIVLQKLNLLDYLDEWLQDTLPHKFYDALPKVLISLTAVIIILVVGFQLGNLAGKLVVKLLERNNVDKTVH